MSQIVIYILLGYVVLINVIAFVCYGVDKALSKTKKSRIPEKVLLLLAFVGGSLGALLGMLCFRHKTMHWKFMILVPLFLVLQLALCGYLFLKDWKAESQEERDEAIAAMVRYVSVTYPKANLQDVYKTCYQDYFGSEHMSPDTAAARYWLQQEIREARKDEMPMPKHEPTGWRHRYERVSLKCIIDGEMTEEELLGAFLAARQPLDSVGWQSEWRVIDSIAVEQVPEWEDEALRADLKECALQCAPVRQSDAFRAAYHPHYRIALRYQ